MPKIYLKWYKNRGRGNGGLICLGLKADSERLRKSALGRSISHYYEFLLAISVGTGGR